MNQQEGPNRLLHAIVAMAIVVALLWFFLTVLPMITSGSPGAFVGQRGEAASEYRQAAGAFGQSLIAVLFGDRITDAAFVGSNRHGKTAPDYFRQLPSNVWQWYPA